jgi:hypothetical protein
MIPERNLVRRHIVWIFDHVESLLSRQSFIGNRVKIYSVLLNAEVGKAGLLPDFALKLDKTARSGV